MVSAQENLFCDMEERYWAHVPIEDPRIARLADGHYSRQTVGAKGAIGPGWRCALWHDGARGGAAWGVVLNRFRGQWYWRNSLFRNESGTLSSTLIAWATLDTYNLWLRRYRTLPTVALTTEVDIEATAARRSRSSPPGRCYLAAGWIPVRTTPREHGRSPKAILAAPWWYMVAAAAQKGST